MWNCELVPTTDIFNNILSRINNSTILFYCLFNDQYVFIKSLSNKMCMINLWRVICIIIT